MSDSDLHWSNSMEIDGETVNLWSATEIRHSLLMPELQRMLFGMLCTEGISATERTSAANVANLYKASLWRPLAVRYCQWAALRCECTVIPIAL